MLHTNYNNKHKVVNKDPFHNEEVRDRRFIMGPETISNPFLQSSNINNSEHTDTKVKIEPDDLVFDNNLGGYSIIGKILAIILKVILYKVWCTLDIGEVIVKSEPHNIPSVKNRVKKENTKGTHHEALQRIYGESDVSNHYQHHWFSSSLEVNLILLFLN